MALISYYLKAPAVDHAGIDGAYDFKVYFNARRDVHQPDGTAPGPLPEQHCPIRWE